MTVVDDLAVQGFLQVAARDAGRGIVVKDFEAEARRWRVYLVPQLMDQCLVTVTEMRCDDSGKYDLKLHRRHEHDEDCDLYPDDGWVRGYTYPSLAAAAAAALGWDPDTEGEPYGWHRAVLAGHAGSNRLSLVRRRPGGDVNRETTDD